MKISAAIQELQRLMAVEGDIELTCTATILSDEDPKSLPDVWESTADTFIVRNDGPLGHRVRVYW